MNASLCLIDRDRKIFWKNRTFDQWFGDAFEEPGLPAFEAKLAESETQLHRVFKDGKVEQADWAMFTPLGQRRYFDSIIAPIKDESGTGVEQALFLTQDVTEQETRVEQLSLLRELSQFLQRTLDIEKLNEVILLCVTAGHALGFNRAFLFKRDRVKNSLDAK